MWNNPILARLIRVFSGVSFLVVFGTLGYAWLEKWPLLDGFYMTVITLSTVGYGEARQLTSLGRCFTTVLIFMCIITMTFWSAMLTSFIVGNDLSGHFLRRSTLRMIAKLKDHTIVCGAGMMGQAVLERLMRKRQSVVLIDTDEQVLESLRRRFPRLCTICGSATNELTLAEANILQARHVVAAMTSEVDNLLVSITCQDMGHNIHVYARSNEMTIGNRMRKAGVDEVISPSQIGGSRIAELILSHREPPRGELTGSGTAQAK